MDKLVKAKGRPRAVTRLAISLPDEVDNMASGLKRSRFRAALRDGETIEQNILVPVVVSAQPD